MIQAGENDKARVHNIGKPYVSYLGVVGVKLDGLGVLLECLGIGPDSVSFSMIMLAGTIPLVQPLTFIGRDVLPRCSV